MIISIIVFDDNKTETFSIDGVSYSVTIDGEEVNEFPNIGNYTVNVNCKNAKGKWIYNEWTLRIDDIKSNPSCNLEFTSYTSLTPLDDHIVSLSGSVQGTGKVVNEKFTQQVVEKTGTKGLDFYTDLINESSDKFLWDDANMTWTSTNNVDSATSEIKFKPAIAGNIVVEYDVSSEGGYDGAEFYLNNKLLKKFENTTGVYTIEGAATTDEIKITYYKDSSNDSGRDNIIFRVIDANVTNNEISTGFRYQGKNPNNYIWFNEELWRIIGVFDTVKADGSTERLTKIIRDGSIGGLVIDAGNVNDWAASDLKAILNGAYFNSTNGNNNVTSTDHCYGYETSVPGNCDYTNKGLNSDARNMVENVKWNLGGLSSAGTPENVYTSERGTTVSNGRPTSTTGNIGLMYLSDYGYSVLSSSCARTTTMDSYSKSSCAGESWMYYGNYAWTLVPNSSNANYVWYVHFNGFANDNYARLGYGSFPVLYLKSNTKIIEGMGSVSDPYQIKI